jgi:Putative zinc-finger
VTTCDDVRPLLPDFALGSLEGPEDLDVRRHLRGCAACRRELQALSDGLEVFASALERPAPPELHDRVTTVLAEEWAVGSGPTERRPPAERIWRVAVAASIALVVLTGAFGAWQLGRARDAARDATSYRAVLDTLGGTGFRVGTLQSTSERPVVFVRTPELDGDGRLVVSRSDGTTWDPGIPLEFDGDGDAAVWWVTDRSINSMTGLRVMAPDGSTLATAGLRPA